MKDGENLDENELSTYSNRVDIMGNFVIEGDGEDRCVRMSFGKYNGKPVRDVDPSYLDWVGDNDEGFPSDTRFYAKQFAAKIRSGKK
jgi:hypothetical protein